MVIVPASVFAVAYSRTDVPRPSDMQTNQVSTIYMADGTTVLGKVVPAAVWLNCLTSVV